jgi:anaerobic selenocysteine-containing dehydrogenase
MRWWPTRTTRRRRASSNSLSEAYFAAIGATVVAHTICAHTMGESWDSVYDGMASADRVPWWTRPRGDLGRTDHQQHHFPPLVQQAAARGAKVVVIDPRRTETAARADLHLAVRPGTDTALAYAIAHQWARHGHLDREFLAVHASGVDEFLAEAQEWTPERAADMCGLAAADIRTLAEWWGTTGRRCCASAGAERNANGGGLPRVLALPVLGGHVGQPGSGVIGSVSTGAVKGARRWPEFERRERRTVPMHQIGRWLAPEAADPCRVLFVQGANPVVMCPDQQAVIRAFARDDVFTVVHEQVLTDTARYADVVLPATTSFEVDDVGGSYGSYMVMPVRAVIDRVGESRSNDEVGLALANAMGFDWTAPEGSVAVDGGNLGPYEADVARAQFVDTFPSGGVARLADPAHGVPHHRPLAMAVDELVLISPATSKLVNSMFGEFQSPSPAIMLHPADAAARGLHVGATVRVTSAVAAITVPLATDATVRPGVAVMAKGVWLSRHPDGLGVNALTPATGDPAFNGACFNDAVVTVGPA